MRFLLGLKPVVLSILVCAASTSVSLLTSHGSHNNQYRVNWSDLHDHVNWNIGVVQGTSFVAHKTHMEHQQGLTTWLGAINETSHVTVTWNSSDSTVSRGFHLTIAVPNLSSPNHIRQYESKNMHDFVFIESTDIELPDDSPRDAHLATRNQVQNVVQFDTLADTTPVY